PPPPPPPPPPGKKKKKKKKKEKKKTSPVGPHPETPSERMLPSSPPPAPAPRPPDPAAAAAAARLRSLVDLLLYALAHAVYAAYWRALRSWRGAQARWRRQRDALLRRRVTSDSVNRSTRRLEKLPAHLAVVLPDAAAAAPAPPRRGVLAGLAPRAAAPAALSDRASAVGDLVCWSLAAGFEELSLYDADGTLKSAAELLERTANESAASFFAGEPPPCVRVETSLRAPRAREAGDVEPNVRDNRSPAAPDGATLRLNLLSREDGKWAVAAAARDFGAAIREKKLSTSDITPLTLDRRLTGRCPPGVGSSRANGGPPLQTSSSPTDGLWTGQGDTAPIRNCSSSSGRAWSWTGFLHGNYA
ncbi:MAG: hypothetical protein BJ554DRAFT_3010, partial [Olpidium bornovanus]